MIHPYKLFLVFFTSLFFLLGFESSLAQGRGDGNPGRFNNVARTQPVDDSRGRTYGIGLPESIRDLPPGILRNDMKGLSAEARGKAMGWLQQFEFPVEDVSSLRVNVHGEVHYADTFLPQQVDAPVGSTEITANALSDPQQALFLHSRPGASNVLFLDFDGHTFSATAWDSGEFVALPFDSSHNDTTSTVADFTQDEFNRIHEIWHRIAENYAPFDIDVTTEEPAVFTPTTGHLLFTHDTDANGRAMPHQGAGGVAFINVFGHSEYVSRFSPTLIYYTNLISSNHGTPNYTADAASHEFGHNIGLSHDGIVGGTAYYQGHGTGLVSWSPIMGMLFYNNVTQWSKGEYPNANMLQDDIAMIAEDLGYIGDDHGESAAQATALVVEANGNILVSSPELDPENLLSYNKGIIDDRSDVDWFYFDAGGPGTVNLTATPAWHSFARSTMRGGSLDIELSIFDANLDLVDYAEPENDTSASVSFAVSAGRYFIQIDGVGNNIGAGYSDYASLGMYFLEGHVDALPLTDSTPPTPAVMSWQSAPHATGQTSISMTAVYATDDSGVVEYYFSCVVGGSGCVDSGWQTSQSHIANGLSEDTYYAYTVKVRDASGNQNSASPLMGDTTNPVILNQAPHAVASYTPEPAVIIRGKTASVTLDGSSSYDPDGTLSNWSWTDASGAIMGHDVKLSLKLRQGSHEFTLTVTDNDGATDSVKLSVSIAAPANKFPGRKPPKG